MARHLLAKLDAEEDQLHTLPNLGGGFLDCGAYSVLTKFWDSLPVTSYADFVALAGGSFERIAAPDIIGDMPGTFKNLKQFQQLLARAGVWESLAPKVVVTYHLTDKDFETMRSMLTWAWEHGIRWLAIGGIVTPGISTSARYALLQATYGELARLGLPFKIHLFGGYFGEFIRDFRPDSVDSATYIQAARVLQFTGYDGWDMLKQKASRKSEQDQLAQIAYHLDQHAPWISEELSSNGASVATLLKPLPDGIRFWFVNLATLPRFETFVRKETGVQDFKYWVTIAVSMPMNVVRYSPEVQQLFWRVWRGRCLMAFPTFFEDQRELKYLGQLKQMFRSQ